MNTPLASSLNTSTIQYEGTCLHNAVLPVSAARVLVALESAGYEAWVVGGWVRDALMGIPSHDVDMCCSAAWQDSEAALIAAGIQVERSGIKFGGLTAVVDGERLEVTTYRIDGFYTDSRHPEQIAAAACVEDDLKRRDFTINAMAWHPTRGLLDMFDGEKDLQMRVLRCVGKPTRRFSEDALRMLRAIRFAARLDFTIEPTTLAALDECAPLLDAIARERVGVELSGMLKARGAHAMLQACPRLICQAIDELYPSYHFDQKTPYHCYDVYEHTAHVVEQASSLLRAHKQKDEFVVLSNMWAALLHDIGKPACFSVDAAGQGHFFGHPHKSASLSAPIFKRLSINLDIAKRSLVLIEHHDERVELNQTDVLCYMHRLVADKNYKRRCGMSSDIELFDQMIDLRIADTRAKAQPYREYESELEQMRSMMHELVVCGAAYSIQTLNISGKDLIAHGVEPGRQIKQMLDCALKACMSGDCANETQALLAYLL